MKIMVIADNKEYPIYIGRGLLNNIEEYISFGNKTLILTDALVPQEYVQMICNKNNGCVVKVVSSGEGSKSFETYRDVISTLMEHEFTRKDLVISLGGGVVGDLGGFVSSTFKRGLRFINIPTTTLSMVDSSIGGKNGINFGKIKNAIGSFYQPEEVIIDLDTLRTLPKRHYYNGLVEALKSGLIGDKVLFDLFKKDIDSNLEEIIIRSLNVKKNIVQIDPYEKNLRKVLNFGHTIGHAIETYYSLEELYHGEAVAIGMLKVLEGSLKEETIEILKKFNIDLNKEYDKEIVYKTILQDKKVFGNEITLVLVKEAGKSELIQVSLEKVKEML